MGKQIIPEERGKMADKNSEKERTAIKKTGNNGKKRPEQAERNSSLCPVSKLCGGCQYLDMPYEGQLKLKQQQMQKLLGSFCKVYPIVGMENPFHYRNKVHAVFGWRKGEVISGV